MREDSIVPRCHGTRLRSATASEDIWRLELRLDVKYPTNRPVVLLLRQCREGFGATVRRLRGCNIVSAVRFAHRSKIANALVRLAAGPTLAETLPLYRMLGSLLRSLLVQTRRSPRRFEADLLVAFSVYMGPRTSRRPNEQHWQRNAKIIDKLLSVRLLKSA